MSLIPIKPKVEGCIVHKTLFMVFFFNVIFDGYHGIKLLKNGFDKKQFESTFHKV
jgi:hypothetical protein